MKKIAVISSTDYNTYPVGGMMSFIKDSAPTLAKHFDVDYWGVDIGGSPHEFFSGGQRFAIRFFGQAKTVKKIVPNMVRVTWHLYRKRREIFAEGYDGIYLHGIPLNLGFPGRIGPKRINHVHGLTNPFLMQGIKNWQARLLAPLYTSYRRSVVCKSDLVLLAADHLGIELFRADHLGTTPIEKIENFCDISLFSSAIPIDRKTEGMEPRGSMLVHVGRFAYQKDPLLAIRAFAAFQATVRQLDDVLVMIGDGPLLEEGRVLAQDLGVASQIRFLGSQPRAVIASWLAGADLYLYTSHANGYPISLAEAAQSGLPIVSTTVTGVHDLVVPGHNGVLVQGRTPASFVAPIIEALENRIAYGQASRELAAKYSPGTVLTRLCQEIANVL
jgi:glycosyltransferase involved in cell wall biosynthesis